MSRVFRGKFVAGLKPAFRRKELAFFGPCLPLAAEQAFHTFLRTLFREDWVVYAKQPFGGPEHVLHYLAQYTHRVATLRLTRRAESWGKVKSIAQVCASLGSRVAVLGRSVMTPRETVPQFRFRRLYFDTNIFIREHWPSIVGKLENVLALAKSLGVSLYLPEVVELELEAHWMREFDKKCQAVDHHMHPLNESLARLNAQKPLGIRTPYRDAVHKCYLEAVAKNKTHWNFQSVPVPELVAKDLLGMAVARKLAFGDNGSNFQDTLLYLSIIEQLQTYGRIQAAFVSADKIFIERKRALQESAAAKGVELVIYENLDSVAEEMRLREEESVRQIIERDRAVALQALQTNIPAIEEWLSAHLRDFHWEIPGWTNVGTWDITEIKVQRVVSATPTFDTVRQKHQRVGITFVIEANLQGTRSDRELLMPPLSNLEYPRPYYTLPPGDPLTSPPPESILMSARLTRDFGARLIEIEGQATFDGQTYIDVVFLSARLKDVSAPIIVPRAQ